MLEWQDFQLRVGVDGHVLELWIAEGWLVPETHPTGRRFSEIDLARANLIRDLGRDLGVNEEGVGVVLDLVDQIHGLRRALRLLTERDREASPSVPAPRT